MQETFTPFGAMHAVVVLTATLAWVGIARIATRLKGTRREAVFRRWFGLSILAVNLTWVGWLLQPSRFNIDVSIPIHLCDFAWMACAWSMLRGRTERSGQLPHDLAYFWALGLSPLSYITPTVTDGPARIDFWMFFIPHWQIVAVGIMNLASFGYRTDAGSLRRTLVVSIGLFGVVTVVNMILETPYFFSGRGSPDNPTPIDFLGAWPLRLVWMILLVSGLFAVMSRVARRREPLPQP